MSRQMYKIKQEIEDNGRVALEVEWVGTLAVPFGSIPAGGADEGLFCSVSGVPGRQDHQATELRLFRGLVAHRPETWGKYGEVPGYYYGIHFCGTVQPLSSKRYAGSMRLCGQGSC